MDESCFVVPTCQRKDGTHVESKLFSDLWKLSGNYEWTEKQYKIATDSEYLAAVSPYVAFDENGQITAKSFLDIADITFHSDEIKERLLKQWGDMRLPADKVVDRVAEFNNNEELKDDYIPVIDDGGEVVKFTIAKRNPERVAKLEAFIKNHELLKIVSDRLKDLGVAYDFIGEKERYNGRFSTENAEKAFDGLYHLIEIADGGNIEDTLLEESAHLATLACKDSVFINRLLNAINENSVHRLFSKEELNGVDLSSRDAKLELAGRLVAKAMKSEATEFKGLLGNIKRVIYKIFSKSKLSSLLPAKRRAQIMAERLAHGFLYNSEEMDVEVALKTPKSLYSTKPINEEAKTLKQVLTSIKELGSRVDTFSANAYNDTYRQLSEKAVLKEKDYATIDSTEAVGHINAAVGVLLKRLDTIATPLLKVDDSFFDKQVSTDDINVIYEADSVFNTLVEIISIYKQLGLSTGNVDEALLKEVDQTIEKIKETCIKFKESLEKCKILYATQLMREFCGSDNIDLAADIHSPEFFDAPTIRESRSYSMKNIVSFYNDELTDTNSFLTFFKTYSNNKDITTQVFYTLVRQAKAKEAIDYNEEITKLIGIEKEWKQFIKKNPKFSDLTLFERLDDGSLTGYFVSDVKKGQFERDREDVKNKVKLRFLEELQGKGIKDTTGTLLNLKDYKRLTRNQKLIVFNNYLEDSAEYKEFMASAYSAQGILSDKYVNHEFLELRKNHPEFKELYEKIIEYKGLIDKNYLTDISDAGGGRCHGVTLRIPQFKAGAVSRIAGRNSKLITDRDLYDSRNLRTICLDVTSDYFGSPITEEVAFKGESKDNAPNLKKLALYGINMLENPNDLSLNIFKSLELYTEMAARFHTSQSVVSKLELFNSQLKNREVSRDILDRKKGDKKARKAKTIATNKRENILDNFIYEKNSKGSFWVKVGGIVGAFGAIRALCFAPIAGLKNYIAGYRVLVQDVKAGILEDVTLKDVIKATLVNIFNPKHFAGEVGRILYGKTLSFDHYQKLVDRWDSYRTPNKIHRKRGFHPLQTIVNIAMANYSVTDNALIATIYYSKLSQVKLYDAISGKKVAATDAYVWKNNNPRIKEGLLLNQRDLPKYRALSAALNSVNYIMENNSVDTRVKMSLFDSKELGELEDFYIDNNLDFPPIRRADGTYKSAKDVAKILNDSMKELCFNENEEFKICNGINDYIISSQGVYGMLNATEFQTNAYTQSLGKIKGYMFGIAQRNFFTNYRVSNQKVNHAVMESVKLALWSVFSGAKEISAAGDISPAQYRLYTATLCFLPISFLNKECVKHLQRCGWDLDQLQKLVSFAIGFWINLTLSILSRMLYRGNEKAIGAKVHKNKGKMPLDKAALDGAIALFTSNRSHKLIEPGILFPESGSYIDEEKANRQKERWEKSGFLKNQRNPEEGYFEFGSREFEDRLLAFDLKNTVYNTQDPLYYMTGAFYRFTRGVRDEGVTLMNPLRFANDALEMAQFNRSIVLSSGLGTLLSGVVSLFGSEDLREAWLDREINFYLAKIGLTYDRTPDEGLDKIQLLDWYGKQDTIDRYLEQERTLPQPWN